MVEENEEASPLTEEERKLADALSKDELDEIDSMLLSQASPEWRKVARVVGFSMMDFGDKYYELPDTFFLERVIALVEEQKLESQGNLRKMRFSEVRLV
jgi:hypothetical protein